MGTRLEPGTRAGGSLPGWHAAGVETVLGGQAGPMRAPASPSQATAAIRAAPAGPAKNVQQSGQNVPAILDTLRQLGHDG